MERRIFAVHATRFVPVGGIVRAGAAEVLSSGEKSIDSEPPSFRPTLHFALGELVRDHDGVSWEQCPYAVVLPLGSLKSQLLNLNTYDTFILGDLRLSKEAILIMPKSQSHQAPPGVGVEFYDEKVETLRIAVDRVIAKFGGWHIQMEEKTPTLDSVGMIGDYNLNSAVFFEPFLRDNPRVAFGSHTESQTGTAFRFGVIEQALNRMAKGYGFGMRMNTNEMIFIRNYAAHHLGRLEKEIVGGGFPDAGLMTFRAKRDNVLGWLNFFDADLQLRLKFGVTLQRADPHLIVQAMELRRDPVALREYLSKHLLHFAGARADPPERLDPSVVGEMLAGTPLDEMKELTENLIVQGSLDADGLETLNALYALRRTLALDLALARKEGVLGLLESSLSRLVSSDKHGDIFRDVMEFLEPYLDVRSAHLDTALQMLQFPQIKAGVEAQYGFQMPAGQKLTLQRLLRVHPETRRLFEEKVVLAPSTALKIMQTLQPERPREAPVEYGNFKAARRAAWGVESTEGMQKRLKALEQPMMTTRDLNSIQPGMIATVYEKMRRGDFGPLEGVWAKFGLKDNFRKAFPQDSDFWQSKKSFVQIYEMIGR